MAIRYYRTDSDNVIYYAATNAQGDVLALYTGGGILCVTYEYDSWGNLVSMSDTTSVGIGSINPIRYRGYYFDSETGLYYVSSRYYDPDIGRWINADGLIDNRDTITQNIYVYCANNPVSRVDIGGFLWDTIFDVVSLCLSVGEVVANPLDPWSWAGLAGDVIDLIPFVTGVGETTKAIGATIKITNTIDNTCDTIEVVKAVDFTSDALDTIKSLDKVGDATKSTRFAGTKIHKGYKATDSFSEIGKEYRRVSGIRLDYFEECKNLKIIYELKPMNPRGIRDGIRQLQKYNEALGGGCKLVLELY